MKPANQLWTFITDCLMWAALVIGMLAIIFGLTSLLIYPAQIPFFP